MCAALETLGNWGLKHVSKRLSFAPYAHGDALAGAESLVL